MFKKIYTATLTTAKVVIPAKAGIQRNTGFRVKPGMTERIGLISSCIKIDLAAVTFDLHRLLLALTIWSCHIWVAPTFRLCHVLAAATFGFSGLRTGRKKIAGAVLQAKAFCNLLLGGVKRLRSEAEANPEVPRLAGNKLRNPLKNEIATPSGLAMTCQESKQVSIHCSKVFDSRPGIALIKSIPTILGHGVNQPMGQGETPNSELLPARSALAKAGRTPNFKGFTLIELIVVMVIIGILAATVLPRIDFGATSSRASVDGAANMIASDIRYAQECAMANRVSKSIRFAIGQNSYTFPATVPSTSGLDPSGQLMSGVTVSNNSTDPYIVQFNSLGEPIVGANGWVEVTIGGQTKRITVLQYTGKVNIS